MYTIAKQFSFSAAHVLDHLPEGHPCARLHGHNYGVEVELRAATLNADGMVLDYRELGAFKRWIDDTLDHRNLNDVFAEQNPGRPTTAEELSRFLYDRLCDTLREAGHDPSLVSAVRVSETPKTVAEYRP